MTQLLESVNDFVWGVPALILILGVGLYLSLRTRFAQLRLFPKAMGQFLKQLLPQNKADGKVSQFQALCTALAATVGTGNLAGVAGAIAIGGPGAVFWMWVCAILGMVTKFAEATLAVRFRQRSADGTWAGGPMYMIEKGLGKRWRWLAGIYCFFGLVAAFGVGNCTQINAVVTGFHSALAVFGIEPGKSWDLTLGILLGVLVGAMLLGGARRIGHVAERLVPFASLLYMVLCAGVLVMRFDAIPEAFRQIFVGAFSPRAVTGGMIGSCFSTLRIGISRGVFTNEAGMGTASMAHAGAEVSHPAQQGLMGIMEVFLDTIVICTMTALVILCSGVSIPYGLDEGLALTTRAFCAVCGDWAAVVIALETCCFAFATVLGWGLYGARCAQYLFGESSGRVFAVAQGVTVVAGAILKTGTVWLLADTMNGLMAIPNLIAVGALTPELVRLTNEFTIKPGMNHAKGGTYEHFHQREPLRTLSHAEIPSSRRQGKGSGQNDLSSEHRPARPGDPPGVL